MQRSLFASDPPLRVAQLVPAKISNRGGGEECAQFGDPFLPRLLTDHGYALYLCAVLPVETEIVPRRARIPAMEILHDKKEPHFSVTRDGRLPTRNQFVVIGLREFS